MVEDLLRGIWDVLFPPTCPGCGRPASGLCTGCSGRLTPARELKLPGLDRVVVGGRHAGPLRDTILHLKVRGRTAVARDLAILLEGRIRQAGMEASRPWCVTEVPTGAWRTHLRGFHPARAVARELARRLGFEWRSLLNCRGNPPEQKRLPLARRRSRSQADFVALGPAPPQVLLVDDVITTGATLAAAAAVLRGAGAVTVWGAAAAHQPAWREGQATGCPD